MADEPRIPRAATLDAAEEVRLARAVEAGVLAADLLGRGRFDHPDRPTVGELRQLVREAATAQQRFIEANLRLVGVVSRQAASRSGASAADLFQEGCLGLIVAVQRFDHRRGCRFATYALFWIRAYVGAASATRLGELGLPAGRAGQLRVARGIAELVGQTVGRAPTTAEIATQIGRPERWTEELLATRPPISLDGAGGARVRDEATANESVPDTEVRAREQLARELIAALPERERHVLMLRLGLGGGDPLRTAQVAARLGIGVGVVRRLEAAAIERLRAICPVSARDHLSA